MHEFLSPKRGSGRGRPSYQRTEITPIYSQPSNSFEIPGVEYLRHLSPADMSRLRIFRSSVKALNQSFIDIKLSIKA
jgi:hypothetical protein